MAAISTWSTTAASNNAAPPDGAPEGWAPSTVNAWGREIMASVRTWYEAPEWIDDGVTKTFASATSFTMSGDFTATYLVNRRIRVVASTPGTIYGTISISSEAGGTTTITIIFDTSTQMSNETLTISYAGQTTLSSPHVLSLLGSATAAVSASVDFDTPSTLFRSFMIEFEGVQVSETANLMLRFATSGSYQVTNYPRTAITLASGDADVVLTQSSGDTNINIARSFVASSSECASGRVYVHSLADATVVSQAEIHCTYSKTGNEVTLLVGGGYYGTAEAQNGIQILPSAGTLTKGEFRLYGLRNA